MPACSLRDPLANQLGIGALRASGEVNAGCFGVLFNEVAVQRHIRVDESAHHLPKAAVPCEISHCQTAAIRVLLKIRALKGHATPLAGLLVLGATFLQLTPDVANNRLFAG